MLGKERGGEGGGREGGRGGEEGEEGGTVSNIKNLGWLVVVTCINKFVWPLSGTFCSLM